MPLAFMQIQCIQTISCEMLVKYGPLRNSQQACMVRLKAPVLSVNLTTMDLVMIIDKTANGLPMPGSLAIVQASAQVQQIWRSVQQHKTQWFAITTHSIYKAHLHLDLYLDRESTVYNMQNRKDQPTSVKRAGLRMSASRFFSLT